MCISGLFSRDPVFITEIREWLIVCHRNITLYCYIMTDETETLSFLKIPFGDVIPNITDLSAFFPFNHFNLASIDTRFTVLI